MLKGEVFQNAQKQLNQYMKEHAVRSPTYAEDEEDVFTKYLELPQLEKCMCIMMPILKLDNGLYMIGTQ